MDRPDVEVLEADDRGPGAQLTGLSVAPGLSATAEQGGEPVRLPLALPPETVTGERSTVELLLRLTVEDCADVQRLAELDTKASRESGSPGVLTVTVVGPDAAGEVAVLTPLLRRSSALRRLVSGACP